MAGLRAAGDWLPVGLSFFWPRRHAWDWMEHGNLVMLVSLLVAPYCWLWDHSLAIPALLYGASRTSSRKVLAALAVLLIVLQVQPYVFQVGLNSKLFLWPAVAWIVWYGVAMRSARTQPGCSDFGNGHRLFDNLSR